MRIPTFASLALAGTLVLPGASPAQERGAPCLPYEPDTVAISGSLARKTFPGRPNYESIKDGDEPETGYYLELRAPVCTIGSPDSTEDNNASLQGIRLVQLVLDSAGYDRLRPHLGRRVALRGTLFAAITGHHHAPLLLRVTSGP